MITHIKVPVSEPPITESTKLELSDIENYVGGLVVSEQYGRETYRIYYNGDVTDHELKPNVGLHKIPQTPFFNTFIAGNAIIVGVASTGEIRSLTDSEIQAIENDLTGRRI